MKTSPLRVIAPAKVNLCLHVLGRREDGYHHLSSLAVFTAFGDELEFTPAHALSLKISGPFADALKGEPLEKNLIWRAAESLAQGAGLPAHAAITLKKNIPVGAGLGGGSSDAAATLAALSHLWGCSLPQPQLQQLALSLGSDVPACIKARPVWIRGVGDVLTPASWPGGWLLLANPRVSLSTPEVYGALRPPYSPQPPVLPHGATLWQASAWAQARHNALEAPALVMQPAIRELLSFISRQPGCMISRMSGSGATCFGLFDNQAAAKNAADALSASHPQWWSAVTRILD